MDLTARTNLTAARTRLVGRDDAQTRLAALFERGAKLVTITGPAGVGKTHLVHQFAFDALAASTFDGAWFCDLTAAGSRDEFLRAVVDVLDLPLSTDSLELASERLGRALGARGRALVVLDGLENVIEHAADAVRRWSSAAPELRILVASRERLGLAGEASFELSPLDPDDAVALFVERADACGGLGTRIEGDDTVRRIVGLLDGLPLAVELAAAQTDVLTPAQILERLRSSLELLQNPQRDPSARHTSLAAALAVSWERLDAWERRGLVQCTVFRGGFSLRAAEAVVRADEGHTTLELLGALKRRSLVRAATSPLASEARYAIYEVVRHFSAKRWPEIGLDEEEVFTRHAEQAIADAERRIARLPFQGEAEVLAWLALEADNLGAAFDRSVERDAVRAARAVLSLHPLRRAQGPREALALLERSVAAARRVGDLSFLVGALLARSEGRLVRNDFRSALRDAEAARRLARRAGARLLEADGLRLGSVLRRRLGQFRRAVSAGNEALATYEAMGAFAAAAGVLRELGTAHHNVGALAEARRCFERALALHRVADDPVGEALSATSIGRLELTEGRPDLAVKSLEVARAIHERLGASHREAIAQFNVGLAHHHAGKLDDAREWYASANAKFAEMGDEEWRATVLVYRALLELDSDDPAETLLLEALAIHERSSDRYLYAVACVHLGFVYVRAGDASRGVEWLGRAIDSGQLDRDLDALGRGVRAVALAALGRRSEARLDMDGARATAANSESPCTRIAVDAFDDVMRSQGDAEAVHRSTARLAAWDSGEPTVGRSLAASMAHDLLRRALAREAATATDTRSPESVTRDAVVLELEPDAWWFRFAERRVDLSRRRSLRLILLALARRQNGTGLGWEELLEAGWPGEAMRMEAGYDRVRTAVRTLRDLGLRGLLLTRDDGYTLDPAVTVRWASRP